MNEDGSSYPGPEPGAISSMGGAGYSLAARAMMFPHLYSDEADKKKFKDKAADKRARLRKLALWLQKGE